MEGDFSSWFLAMEDDFKGKGITVAHVLKEELLGKWNWMAGGKA